MSNKSKITILGATGSVGDSTVAVIRDSQDFEVFALSGFSNINKLADLCNEFYPKYAVVTDENARLELEKLTKTKILVGESALELVASAKEVDLVMSAIVGVAGLKPTFAAAKAGKKFFSK